MKGRLNHNFRAAALGTAAFHAGKPCTPVLDGELMAFIKEHSQHYTAPGSALPLFKAWQAAWIAASLNSSPKTK